LQIYVVTKCNNSFTRTKKKFLPEDGPVSAETL